MKKVLCFGDSNTWGYMPGAGTRYPEDVRFTGVLGGALGDGWKIIEEGLNGRTTAFADRIEPERCGLDHLLPVIFSQLPFDYILIMLGTNDTKNHFHATAGEIGQGMTELVIKAKHLLEREKSEAKIIIAAPIPLKSYPGDFLFLEESEKKSKELAAVYEGIAKEQNVDFLDAGKLTEHVPDRLGSDGVHLSPAGHKALGLAFAEYFKKLGGIVE